MMSDFATLKSLITPRFPFASEGSNQIILIVLPVAAIKAGLDVIVGTPGRILDHMVNGTLDLSQLK